VLIQRPPDGGAWQSHREPLEIETMIPLDLQRLPDQNFML
jgi:hypothetical protein